MNEAIATDDLDTSYEPFSREPEYIEANRAFIRTFALTPQMQILDLACGTATMTDLMLESMFAPHGWDSWDASARSGVNGLQMVGLDLSRESLLLGQEHLSQLGFLSVSGRPGVGNGADVVNLIEGNACSLPFVAERFDLVIMGNAIQLATDRNALFSEIRRGLRPGGRFAFNTSFYAGTYCPGTEHVYMRWMQEASAYIARRSSELQATGLPGIRRQRGTAARAFSRPWLSIEEYTQELAAHGLQVQSVNERTVMLNQRCFETIGAYAGLAKVLLSGYPVKLASEALERASGPMLEAVGATSVPRFWLEMVVEKAG